MTRGLRTVLASSLWAVGFSASATVLARDADAPSRPVMKVVRLLQDMKQQLESELAEDKDVHEKLDCWCKENNAQKAAAIADGEATERRLETFMAEATASMTEKKTKRDATLKEVDKDFNELEEANNLRMKESKEFSAVEDNLIEAIKACSQAIVVLKEYNPDAANFAQVRNVAKKLQDAKVLTLGTNTFGGPASPQMVALRTFLAEAQGAMSFLQIPGYQSYGSQSGQIFGILEQMKEDFQQDLSDAQAKDKKAAAEHAALKQAKEEEIAAGRALVADLDEEIADLKAKHAQAFKELEDTQAQLALDRTFVKNLDEKCSMSDDEFNQRVKDRLTEIEAVDDTIAILNSDKAFDNFEKTVNSLFIQESSHIEHRETEQQQTRLRRVVAALDASATRLGKPVLSMLAMSARLDAFTQVKEKIDNMIEELAQQQKDEVDHRDWCIKELDTNTRNTAAANDKRDNLVAKKNDLEKTIAQLTADIKKTTQEIADMQEQMKRESEMREAENAVLTQTILDQRLTKTILNKALNRMKQVYDFLQSQAAPHIQTSGTHTDPGNGPARFGKYEENKGGSKVVRMIEEIIADSRKAEDDAIAASQDQQTAYENFMKETNEGITAYTKKIVNMKKALSQAHESLSLTKSDLTATLNKLEDLYDEKGDLHKGCDYVLKNFDARQAARTAEMDALTEAKAILSGAK